jgi:hypothetical protein
MSTRNYFPSNDSEFITWFRNFIDKLKNIYAAVLEISTTLITQFETDITEAQTKLDELQTARTKAQAATQAKAAAFEAMQKRVRDTVVIMKRHTKFTQTVGEDLGIVTAKPLSRANIPAGTKPTFVATVMNDKVRLDWAKGEFDGVAIYGKRGSETGFTFLGRDNKSPYDDKRPSLVADQPEAREYRMQFLLSDEEVGEWSDIIRVICII